MPPSFILTLAVGMIATIGIALFALTRALGGGEKRETLLEVAAQTRGYAFDHTARGVAELPYAKLPTPRETLGLTDHADRAMQFSNALEGEYNGLEFNLVDFKSSSTGASSAPLRQTIAAFHLPARGLPEFRLFPKTIGHTVLWGEDPYVRFDEPPEFSKRFLGHRAEEDAVRDLLTIDVRRALCDLEGWTVEGKGDWVIAFRSQRLLAPRDLPDFLATARRIAECFREHAA